MLHNNNTTVYTIRKWICEIPRNGGHHFWYKQWPFFEFMWIHVMWLLQGEFVFQRMEAINLETMKLLAFQVLDDLDSLSLERPPKSSSHRETTMMEPKRLSSNLTWEKNSNWKTNHSLGNKNLNSKKLQPDIVPHTSRGEVLWCLTCCSSVCWPRTSLWLYMCMGGCAMRFSVNWCRIIGTG